ncbi:Tweety [Phytophthora infestans]|uniref:Tweety n=1 Tax=Phytophthora infestans TaxID=4787 RepID=A0A8S9UQW4_PHYIN|nr:Tweety [Phytophthora infestans]KAF4143171.1 Tweety [Phytophthora infestans]
MSSSTFGDLRLLPVDYHRQVAREVAAFFHSFYRFGAASNRFDLGDAAYLDFLHNVLFGSLCIGAVVFLVLCVVVVRRTILHIRSAFVRRTSMDSTSVELLAVGLLTFLAISALGGLLGEAQVDYSAGVVLDTMTNTSDLFQDARELTTQSLQTSNALRLNADNLITSFNDSELPAEAFKMSVEALRLVHASKELTNLTDALLPKNYSGIAKEWEFSYFVLKSSTNGAILAVALASFLSIASVGWAMVSPLRVSILVILSAVPISHTLIGAYLSSTIMTADFCAAPMNNTLQLIGATPVVAYYVECPANASLPFTDAVVSVQQTAEEVTMIQQELERKAAHQGETGQRMKREFLDPIGTQLSDVNKMMTEFVASQTCKNVSRAFEYAATTYCEFGMLGFFSMWVHQILLCLLLFVSVVVSVLVYERVHIREIRQDVRYQLLSSYEEDDVEHVYLSSD